MVQVPGKKKSFFEKFTRTARYDYSRGQKLLVFVSIFCHSQLLVVPSPENLF